MNFKKELEKILAKTPCIDSDCGGQGGTWQGDPENPEPVQCQYCYQECYPFIDQTLTSIINLIDKEHAKLNEELIDALENHKKTLDYIVKDGAPRNPTNYEVYLRKAIEVDKRIAMRNKLRDGE